MSLEEFKKLAHKRQLQLVVARGVSLAQRASKNFSIYLYAIDSFYVEVYFFRESGEYARMKPFDDVDLLDPYLRRINVREVLMS